MPLGLKGFQKGHNIGAGIRFGSGQIPHHKKAEENPLWKGGRKLAKRRWAQNNKEACRVAVIKRRARKRNAEGSFTKGEWELLKKQYGSTCPCCKRMEPEIKLEVDHIIPLVKGGSNFIENIQPLCRRCNSSKSTKIVKY